MEFSEPWMAIALAALPLVGSVGLLAVVVAGERLSWFFQFVKYGTNGVIATYIQAIVFYLLAGTYFKCLGVDDIAVTYFGLDPVDIADGVRALRFSICTAVGFSLANIVCWLMNRLCVFKPGKFRWYAEFAFFFAVSLCATLVALAISAMLIRFFAVATSFALAVEVVVSFIINFLVRKFFIFKG
jgi:putative flippase GtrA